MSSSSWPRAFHIHQENGIVLYCNHSDKQSILPGGKSGVSGSIKLASGLLSPGEITTSFRARPKSPILTCSDVCSSSDPLCRKMFLGCKEKTYGSVGVTHDLPKQLRPNNKHMFSFIRLTPTSVACFYVVEVIENPFTVLSGFVLLTVDRFQGIFQGPKAAFPGPCTGLFHDKQPSWVTF